MEYFLKFQRVLTGVFLLGYIGRMRAAKEPSFAARLRELRERAGLTQAQLAERAGLHISAVTRFEQGWREPSLATAAELAKALGVKVDEFLKAAAESAVPRARGRPPKAAPAVPPADDLQAVGKGKHRGTRGTASPVERMPPLPELPARHDLPGTAPTGGPSAPKKSRRRSRKEK